MFEKRLIHFRQNKLPLIIYWNFSFRYIRLFDSNIPREKWLNYLQTVETASNLCLHHLPFWGSPNQNGLNTHSFLYEPANYTTYDKTCMTIKDSDQPVHRPCMARFLVHPSLDRSEAVEGTCDQRRLWSDCADAQADLRLRWSHILV